MDLSGEPFVARMLERLEIKSRPRRITLAIDTPLAWPADMLKLVTSGVVTAVPERADDNPYLFRAQERAMFVDRRGPLSVVRDMIGSQSTKGIHFLRANGLLPVSIGVWANDGRTLFAIETYPAPISKKKEIASQLKRLVVQALQADRQHGRVRNEWWKSDVVDAISCALAASLHGTAAEKLVGPPVGANAAEGWIWLPA